MGKANLNIYGVIRYMLYFFHKISHLEKEELKNEKFFQEAMRNGYIEITEVKCLLVGPAGVGKTYLKFLLLSKPPPSSRTSTGCRDRPVRVIRVSKLADQWKEIDLPLLQTMIANSIPLLAESLLDRPPYELQQHLSQLRTESADEDSVDASTSPSIPSATTTGKAKQQSPTPHPDPTRQVYSKILDHLSKSKQEQGEGLIESLFNAQIIYFIDSGGQAAFHDLLPLFASKATAAIFVHRLCEALDDYPADEFFKDGERVGPSKKAPATNMDILKCMAQTIHTQLHEGKLPSFLTVGTHLDLEHLCTETREEKNRRIKEFLKPLFPDLQYCDDTLEPLFTLNTAEPKEHDFKTAAQLRKAIENSATEKKAVPIWWYVLELILAALSKELGREVLTYQECLSEAAKLNISRSALKAALAYLHDLNLILHYPKVLPNVVFSDAQVPVAILTSLVEQWYQLTEAKEGKTTLKSATLRNIDWEKFRDEGIITVNFLSSEEFKHHFFEGFFGPEDFLKLLQGVLAAMPLSDNEFFVPAFTTRLPLPELRSHLKSQPISSSFAVCFKSGCAAAGVFCCSIVHLQLQSGWEIIQEPNKSLARNCMHFGLPYSIGIVTVVDHYRFFRVCVEAPQKELSTVCPRIKHDMFSAIKAAATNLHYGNCIPHVGFQCLQQDDDYHRTTPHTVVLRGNNWRCPHNRRLNGELDTSQLVWVDNERSKLIISCQQKFIHCMYISL